MNSTQPSETTPLTTSDINSLGSFVFGAFEMMEKGCSLDDLKRFMGEADIKQSAANAVNYGHGFTQLTLKSGSTVKLNGIPVGLVLDTEVNVHPANVSLLRGNGET